MSTTDTNEAVLLAESDRWNGTLDGLTIIAEGCTFPITVTLGESVVDRFCLCSTGTMPLRVAVQSRTPGRRGRRGRRVNKEERFMTPEAQAVYDELTGRKGIGDELDACDRDVAEEVCEAVAAAVLRAHGSDFELPTPPGPFVMEFGRDRQLMSSPDGINWSPVARAQGDDCG